MRAVGWRLPIAIFLGAQAAADGDAFVRARGHRTCCRRYGETAVIECVEEALRRFGQIDILVNNAGVHCEKSTETSTVEQFNRCLDVNLLGVWRMTQALIPHFRQQRRRQDREHRLH